MYYPLYKAMFWLKSLPSNFQTAITVDGDEVDNPAGTLYLTACAAA